MAIFNSYVSLPEGTEGYIHGTNPSDFIQNFSSRTPKFQLG